ncbi:hypothetical protein KTH81_13850 [Lachnospiraceae bacterium ASD3451]|uniref:DUF5643 domain-containing protein n=1 Tax=Diplocloster agilis TaxID=2850323 RepID=UPI001E168465|nr:DUF5643 domain-containing protein [Diplocloster agilis]MBU9744905.1 hypothetical protein [Diplocloster agilis]
MRQGKEPLWDQAFPEVPECFHGALTQELDRQVRGKNCRRKKHIGKKALLVLAATLILGTTAFAAARHLLLERFDMEREGRRESAENLLQTDITQKTVTNENPTAGGAAIGEAENWLPLEDQSPLLQIRETLYDGLKLYVYADATENGKKYDLNADRLFVEGKECGPVDTVEKNGAYTFRIDLSEQDLPEDFEVRIPVSVYRKSDAEPGADTQQSKAEEIVRYQNQDLIFRVASPEPAQRQKGQMVQLKDCSAYLNNCVITPLSMKIDFSYQFSGDDAEQRANEFASGTEFYFRDDQGNEYEFKNGEGGNSTLINVEQTENQDWRVDICYELSDGAKQIKTLEIIPICFRENPDSPKEILDEYVFSVAIGEE